MMFQRNLVISIFLTAIFCCSEAELKKIIDCIFSNKPQVKDPSLLFAETFNIALESNDNLLKQFNISLPPEEAYKAFRDNAVAFYTATNATNPNQIADDIGKIVQYKLEGLPPQDAADVISKSAEQILKKTGVLKKKNAKQLALKFVKLLNSARNSPRNDGSPQFNLGSLFAAFFGLIKDIIHNNGDIIGEIFEHNIKLLPDRVAPAPDIH